MSQIFYREMPAPGQRSLYHSEERWSRPKSSCACLERGVDTEEGAARLCLSAAHLNKPLARVRMARRTRCAIRDDGQESLCEGHLVAESVAKRGGAHGGSNRARHRRSGAFFLSAMRLGWIAAAKTPNSRISQTRPYRRKTVIDLLS